MFNSNNRFLTLLFTFHLFIILIVCVSSSINSYNMVYEKDVSSSKLSGLRNSFVNILMVPGLRQYSSVAGIDAGYGFFAPNVASSYILKFTVKDRYGNKDIFLPAFKSKEGLIRYSSLLGIFQERLKALEKEKISGKDQYIKKSLYTRYLDVVIKTIGRSIASQDSNLLTDYNMSATLYLYQFPDLKASLIGISKPTLVNLLHFEIKNK